MNQATSCEPPDCEGAGRDLGGSSDRSSTARTWSRGVTLGTMLQDEAAALQPSGHVSGAAEQHSAAAGLEVPQCEAIFMGWRARRGSRPTSITGAPSLSVYPGV